MNLKQEFEEADDIKLLLNIGAGFDIPTGQYITGIHGESILLGGLGWLTAVVGRGNTFKTTIEVFQMLSVCDKLMSTCGTSMSSYDTEMNVHRFRLKTMTKWFKHLWDKDILNDGTWVITDKIKYYGDKWFEKLKSFLESKLKNKKELTATAPFWNRDRTGPVKVTIPTFSMVDSISEFETSDVAKIQDENLLGESGGNLIHARQGLAKTRFMMEIPTLAGANNHFFLLTAHLGEVFNMAAGPYAPPPIKKLQHMPQNEKIVGVTNKFFFLMNNCWHAVSARPLINASTKAPEYPRDSDENNDTGNTDLNIVTLKQLRGKSGPSGITLEVIVSQTEGVLASLTEFNYIKDMDRFGLGGNLQNYYLEIYPEVKLSRTTVRRKLEEDEKLKRAMNITSELCQMHQYYRGMKHELCTATELYEGIKQLGFDWDFILEKTRGWYTLNNDDHPSLYFLSTLDLCRIVKGTYFPYWMNDDKSIKKEFLKK